MSMWINLVTRVFLGLLLVFTLSTVLFTTAEAAPKRWTTLTPMQQEALAPVAGEWDTMPELQQKRLIAASKRYPKLLPDQKLRFLNRLTEWSKLTPAQRNRAREKYKAFNKVPAERREEVKLMIRQNEFDKTSAVAASSSVAPSPDKQ